LDHNAQYRILKNVFALSKDSKLTNRIRIITKDIVTNFTDLLKNVSWDDIFIQEDINKGFNSFLNNLLISFKCCFPLQHNNMAKE
jgi:hypothetical protein